MGAAVGTTESLPAIDLRKLRDLPTIPAVAAQVLQVLRTPNSSARQVEEVVMKDPSLSTKILRAANSAFYGFAGRIKTVAHAVTILGFNNVQGMLLSITIFDKFRARRLDLHGFWQHSIATAIGAKFLAQRANVSVDEAFTAGILHDIGKLAFALLWEAIYLDVLRLQHRESLTSLKAEVNLLNCAHTTVGAMMGEQWSLPKPYIEAIRFHHDPQRAAEHKTLCAITCLANLAAHQVYPTLFTHPWSQADLKAATASLRLPAKTWEACLSHLVDMEENLNAFLAAME